MKSIFYSVLYLLFSLCFVACSSNDEAGDSDLTEDTTLAGTIYSLRNEDYSIADDYVGHHIEILSFYFHSPTEGLLYYGKKDSYTDTGTTRRSAVCHFTYSLNGNNVMLQYLTDEILTSTQLILGKDKLTTTVEDLEFSKGELSYADYEWLNTLHGTTGSCSWYSDTKGGLWIIGEGAMADYSESAETPWVKNERSANRVVIGEGVTEIGSYAFANLYVGEVEMPEESLVRIGKAAFYGALIDNISLSDNITTIEASAFADCKYLKQIDIPESIVSIGEYAFDGTALNEYKLDFGGNLRTIGRDAFFGCEASYLTFAEGVQSISSGAFLGDFCGGNNELILPNSLTSIDATVFRGLFEKIVVGTGITEIGEKAFISYATSGEMHINRSTPPSTGDVIIASEDGDWISAESRWTLYVPKGCKSAYSNKSPWNKFKSIVEEGSSDGPDKPDEPDEPDEPDDNTVHFPDANFKAYMVANFDKNNDGEISKDEASLITQIDCSERNIQSLEGIQYCTALTELDCGVNQLTALDISKNTALTNLYCVGNQLTTLDVSKNTALTDLSCSENQLTSLDVSSNTALTELYCFKNKLTTLDVSKNTALTRLNCIINQLTTLDVSKNTALIRLECKTNKLTTLDVSKNTALTFLWCSYNQLTTLDVSKTNLGNSTEHAPLFCDNMPTLQTLYLKTGWKIRGINANRSKSCIPEQTKILYKD